MMRVRALALFVAVAVILTSSGASDARPNYFSTFTGIYGFTPGEDLYSCGVCHRKWEGTGARNPYGTAIEQQLYVGKTVTDSILDIEGVDTDLDGTSNVDELTVWGTLPGYSCANYTLVINPPLNFQSLITPGVPSCLEPQDLEVSPTVSVLTAEVNEVGAVTVQLANNGTDFPITVSNYELLAGSHAFFSVSGPALPLVIGVGSVETLTLSFSPTGVALAAATLRITSDDPDEPTIDVAASGLGFVKNLAPAAERAACFEQVERRLEIHARKHLREWSRCYSDELAGIACDVGRRDLQLGRAEEKLRSFIGGPNDRWCAGEGLSPNLLDLPDFCGAPCGTIEIDTLSDWASCLVCRQEAATDAMLDAAVGSSPPDLPGNVLGSQALRCNRKVVSTMRRSIGRIQKALGACEVDNVTAAMPVDCGATLLVPIIVEATKVDDAFNGCPDVTGMLGCRFGMAPDPQCLADGTSSIAGDLSTAVFETAE